MMRNLVSLTLMAGIVLATPQAGKAEVIDTKDDPVKQRVACSKILSNTISEEELVAYLKNQWGDNIGKSETKYATPGKGSHGEYWRKQPDGKENVDDAAFTFRRSDQGRWQLTSIELGEDEQGIEQKFTEAIEKRLSDSFKPDHSPLPIVRDKENPRTNFIELHDQNCIYRAVIKAANGGRISLVKDKTAGMSSKQRHAYDNKMFMLEVDLGAGKLARDTHDPRFQLMDFYFWKREINFK